MRFGSVWRLKHFRGEKRIYYGMAVLVLVFIIAGITGNLKEGTLGIRQERETFGKKQEEDTTTEQGSREEQMQKVSNPEIRVLLMTNGYKNTIHPAVTVSSDSGLSITYGETVEDCEPGTEVMILPDDVRFQNGNIRIQAKAGEVKVNSLQRACGIPSYNGVLELRTTAEGIAMINELPVEDYLCRVVPSEMPSSYELEALKAQAVCARSYAYRQMAEYGYPEYEAHVDDSTNYQVYGNSNTAEQATRAVRETAGQVVRLDGDIVTTYYYSTSCGRTTTMEAWGNEANEGNRYLQSVEVKGENGDYERNLPWYRWEAKIPVTTLSNLVGLNTGKDIGTLQDIQVLGNGPGGVVLKIEVVGDKGSVTVETENKIRRALGGKGYTIIKQDGTEVKSSKLLPSAFFTIQKSGDTFVIDGGGFGHGIGMSQTGANEMAKCGKTYQEILTFFYQGVTIG